MNMKAKQMKRIAKGEIAKLAEVKKCKGHIWVGPSQEVQWGNITKYVHHCKHCPLAKLFDTPTR